ncbi:MAG: MaoC family dehydratase [Halanaeroarchaeum sp.]
MTVTFEDLSVGDRDSFGAYAVTEEEMREFADAYDPQWFHTDPERAASESIYGELVASGWHTAAMTMRMLVEYHLADAAALGALGVDDLRWPAPVFAGETLSVETEVIDRRRSESDPSRGVVEIFVRTANDADETKMEMTAIVLYASRRGRD